MSKPIRVQNITAYHALEVNEENQKTLRSWFDGGQQEWRGKSIEKHPDLVGYYLVRQDSNGVLTLINPADWAADWEEIDQSNEQALFDSITDGEFADALGTMDTVEEYQVTAVPDEDGPVWLDRRDINSAKEWLATAKENGLEGRIRVRTVITVARSWKEIAV